MSTSPEYTFGNFKLFLEIIFVFIVFCDLFCIQSLVLTVGSIFDFFNLSCDHFIKRIRIRSSYSCFFLYNVNIKTHVNLNCPTSTYLFLALLSKGHMSFYHYLTSVVYLLIFHTRISSETT